MCARIAFSAAAGWRRRTARWMSRCWRRISAPSTRGEIFSIRCGCRTSRIQPVKESSSSLPAALARIWWKRLSASLNGRRPRLVLGGLVDRGLQRRGGLLGGVGRGQAGQRHLEEHARVEQLAQRHRLGRQHHRDRLGDVAAHALARGARDEDPAGAAAADADQVRGREQPQALAQRRARDAELRRELLLGADPIAGLQPFALEIAPDLERDLMARVDARGGETRARKLGGGHPLPILRQRQRPNHFSTAETPPPMKSSTVSSRLAEGLGRRSRRAHWPPSARPRWSRRRSAPAASPAPRPTRRRTRP